MGAVAVSSLAAEPFAEETLLGFALNREIASEERPQRGVGFDAVVKPIDERIDRGVAADASEEIGADKGTMSLVMSQETAVLHGALSTLQDILSGAQRKVSRGQPPTSPVPAPTNLTVIWRLTALTTAGIRFVPVRPAGWRQSLLVT